MEDIRLLGQILGDTIREQEGEKVFARIETILRLSVAFERDANLDAGHKLDARPDLGGSNPRRACVQLFLAFGEYRGR